MDSNAFLLSFGMKPGDFDRTEGPVESDDGFVYEAWEARKSPICPSCGSPSCVIHNRYAAEIRLRSDILKTEILICHRIRYSCNGCKKTSTSPLKGAMAGRSLTHFQDRKELLLGLRRFF